MRKTLSLKYGIGFMSLVLLCVVAGTVFLSATAAREKEPQLFTAPLNPEFIRYISQPQADTQWAEVTADGFPLGHIPSPVDVEYFYTERDTAVINGLPAKYDLRKQNKLTKVKNQNSCGACWSFAILAAIESSLRPNQTRDFSEQHMIKKHGFKWGPCKGGNLFMALAYLSRWLGPVNETDMPYSYLSQDMAVPGQKHVQNVTFIPKKKNSSDNDKIKKAVKTYGAVYASMYYDATRYNPATNAYYNTDIADGGHSVNIIGWDDNYSKNNFYQIPPKDGAFIVRNSWGEDWGDGGYFYVSYDDKFLGYLGYSAAYEEPENVTNYDRVYDYDPSGWVTSLGYSRETGWFANIFTAEATETIQAVSFYAPGLTNKYEVYVYTGVSDNQPRSGDLAAKKTGKFKNPGYYTVELNRGIQIKKGFKFSVVVKNKAQGTHFPIIIEYPLAGYTKAKNCKAKKGQSFFSWDGISWPDACDWKANTNVCVKAFTKN